MSLNEPDKSIPPLWMMAFVKVERALILYKPGLLAAPSTKISIDLSDPNVTFTSVPIS